MRGPIETGASVCRTGVVFAQSNTSAVCARYDHFNAMIVAGHVVKDEDGRYRVK